MSAAPERGSPGAEFMRGINVQGEDLRDHPDVVLELLKPTPIDWVRVHLLPTRRLDDKGPNGLTYADGLERLMRDGGYNVIAPIDVGYTDNVGEVVPEKIDSFIEQSYDFSFAAAKRISELAAKYRVRVLYGVENEVDMKAWLLQSLPTLDWRGSFHSWAAMGLDSHLKYERLGNIQRGIRDAVPDAKLMTNVIAEDGGDLIQDAIAHLSSRHQDLLRKLSIPVGDVEDRLVDWRAELEYMKGKLDLDLVGLDSYPNYVIKYPVLGGDIGIKVADAEKISGIPVFNPEFGYSTYRDGLEKFAFAVTRRPGADAMQLEFMKNALAAIGKTNSRGTFPWVLITHTDRKEKPRDEAYFGLFGMRGEGRALVKRPAFDYYVEWLKMRSAEEKQGETTSDP